MREAKMIDRERLKLKKADEYWAERDRINASIKPMNRHEYLGKYPNGGPERFTGLVDSEEYREFYAAVKRRDREARRPGVIQFWWMISALALLFIVITMLSSMAQAVFVVLVLIICYCFVQMGANLPHK